MITREITPAYAMLDHSDAEQVMGLLPSEKIMYLPRNQIDRAWSHLRYRFDQGEDSGFSLTSNAQIKSFIDNQKLTLRSDYIGTLQRCKSVVPENQFSIGFYDDIKTEPAVFLKEPGSFLEIDLALLPEQKINVSVLASQKRDIPKEIEVYLANEFYNDLEQLATIPGSHAVQWRDDARQILDG